MNQPGSWEDAFHIVQGPHWSLEDRCQSIVLVDQLNEGPSRAHPILHHFRRWRYHQHRPYMQPPLLRRKQPYLGAGPFLKRIRSKTDNQPLIFWSAFGQKEALALWWALETLARNKFDLSNSWLVKEVNSYFGFPATPVCDCPEKNLITAFEKNREPLSETFIQSASRLWQAYVSQNPIRFHELLQTEIAAEPCQRWGLESFSFEFPVIQTKEGSYSLHLSEADHAILSAFSTEEWSAPLQTLSSMKESYRDLFSMKRISFVTERIQEWARQSPRTPVLESRPAEGTFKDSRDFSMNIEYRLTPAGKTLLDEGLTSPQQAPKLELGGATLYDPQQTWCKLIENDSYSLVKLQDLL